MTRLVLLSLLAVSAASAEPLNVRDFGATGDGVTDDTAAIQAAMDAASAAGGGLVTVPTGNYLCAGTLNVPPHVVVEGVWRAPTARSQGHGSTLLTTAGRGEQDGTPFISLLANSTLRGLTIFYPEQSADDPQPYPWCIRGIGDNMSLLDLLIVNPWQAVDFATLPSGRRYINGLYSQAIYRGLQVDKCLDVGRVENVHFWPFWDAAGDAVREITLEQGVAFSFGRTDWEYVTNCFAISYQVGFEFITGRETGGPMTGPGNVLLTQSGSDMCPVAVRVAETQPHAGVSFSNSQIFGDIIVEPTNRGPVRFSSCGLFGSIDGARGTALARIEGTGRVSFDNCHFYAIHPENQGAYLIDALGGRLSVQNCEFLNEPGHGAYPAALHRGPGLLSSTIVGNSFASAGVARMQVGTWPDDLPNDHIVANNVFDTATKQRYQDVGARWLPASSVVRGSEKATLVPNGDFATSSAPDEAGRDTEAEGWHRVGPAFVEAPTMWPGIEHAMVARPGLMPDEPVGQYYQPLNLEPDTDYIVSGYLWAREDGAGSVRVMFDILGGEPTFVPALPSIPGGIFFALPFNSADVGDSPLLRVWYDNPRRITDTEPWMAAARLAVTRADEFEMPQIFRPGAFGG